MNAKLATKEHAMRTTSAPIVKTAESCSSVSHGTLRSDHLLSAFISELEGAMLVNGDYFAAPENRDERDKLCNLIGEAQDCFNEDGDDVEEGREEEASELVSELADALCLFAPEGHTFGAHEGDGSDFGYWPCNDPFADSDED